MRNFVWIGEECIIPGCGVAATGKIIAMPEDIAQSYLAQGLAVEDFTPEKSTRKNKQEVES